MEQIIIEHIDGSKTFLNDRTKISKVTRATQRQELLGEDVLEISFICANPIVCEIGDYIRAFGSIYTLNQMPAVRKKGHRLFEQTLTLEGIQYELLDVQWFIPGETSDSLTGDLSLFLNQLISNANRVYPGKWSIGAAPPGTETKTLNYTETNCLKVLQNICEEWGTEFIIIYDETTGSRTIHLKTVGVEFPYIFTYGRTGGLYDLSRQNINSKNVVTRLYAYGGKNNLGNKYRANKLCLPGKNRQQSYVEETLPVQLYGVKENTKTFSDIFPARVGSITALGSEYFAFVDNTMFDLNEKEADGETTKWLIPGVGAKIRMQTGNMAGYEFDVHAYDHGTFELQVVPFIDENGFKFPSETSAAFQFDVGDKYIFTDINLPESYITEAESLLQIEAEKYYQHYKQPQVQYSLSIDENFLKQIAGQTTIPNVFAVGDQIHVQDSDIGVDKSIRVTGFTRDIQHPYRYTLTLGEATYNKTIINRIIEDIEDIEEIIEINNLGDPYKARRNWLAAQELLSKIFDPEGYYYSSKIKPLSIETMMLQVGAKSQQFILSNVIFEPNYQGDANVINITAGAMVHYTINDTITIWSLTGGLVVGMQSAESYFVYAKCQRDGSAGSIIIDSTQYTVDGDPNWYYFIIGHLSSVITNPDGSNPARLLSLTYGSTTINGRFIKTGRIESSGGGDTYFDLDNGEIGGNIKFLSNGEYKNPEEFVSDNTKFQYAATSTGTWYNAWATGRDWMRISKDGGATWGDPIKVVGGDGADGKGVVSVTEELAMNDSSTTPPDQSSTSWSTTVPNWTEGKTIWSRFRIKYTVGSDGFTEPKPYSAAEAIAKVNIAKAVTDNFTTIQGGLIQSVIIQLRESGTTTVTAGTSGIQGALKDQPAFWAGGTYAEAQAGTAKAIIRHNGTVKFVDGEFTGTINAASGTIAGWNISSGRIGKLQSSTGLPTDTGLSLYDSFIKFSDADSSVFLGTNVLPASTGMVGMGRITNTNSNIRKIGMYFDMAGADTSFWDGSSNNIAMYINRGVIAGAKFNGVNHNLGAAGYTIGKETVVCIYTTENYTVRLPYNPEPWEFKWIFAVNYQNFTLSGNGKNIWSPFSGSVASLTFKSGVVVYTGQQWAIFT